MLVKTQRFFVQNLLKSTSECNVKINHCFILGDKGYVELIRNSLCIIENEYPEINEIISGQYWIVSHAKIDKPKIFIDLSIIFFNNNFFNLKESGTVAYFVFLGFYKKIWDSGSFSKKDIALSEACKKTVVFLEKNNYPDHIRSIFSISI